LNTDGRKLLADSCWLLAWFRSILCFSFFGEGSYILYIAPDAYGAALPEQSQQPTAISQQLLHKSTTFASK
jgi:hypothetical protein